MFFGTSLYYAQTILLNGTNGFHTAVLWTKLAANPGSVVDGGVIEDPAANSTNGGKWYAYGSIAVNSNQDFVVGFSQFSSAQHPSAAYAFHDHNDPAGTIREPVVYQPGKDYYHKTLGTGRDRWGDYSKAQVDPNKLDFWVFQEYAESRSGEDDTDTIYGNSSRWGTAWAKVTPGRAILNPVFSSGQFRFDIATVSGVSYTVEYKDALGSALWQTGQTLVGDGMTHTITNALAGGHRFFRLRLQPP